MELAAGAAISEGCVSRLSLSSADADGGAMLGERSGGGEEEVRGDEMQEVQVMRRVSAERQR